MNAEGYNHLLGFYESFDGGATWPVQGHVPGYEGWTDNTDPVGAFDPWGNFYSLVLPYQFYYDNSGVKKFDNGSNQTNPTVPPEAIAVSVHPAAALPGKTPAASWITTHNGQPDYLDDGARTRNTNDPDKQWIAIDTNPSSPHYGRVYAMWTLFVLNPSVIYESHADARPDGTAHGLVGTAGAADRLGQALGHVPAAPRRARRDGLHDASRTIRRRKDFASTNLPDLVEGRRRRLGTARCRSSKGVLDTDLPEHDVPRGDRQHLCRRPAARSAAPTRSTSPTRTARAVCRTST